MRLPEHHASDVQGQWAYLLPCTRSALRSGPALARCLHRGHRQQRHATRRAPAPLTPQEQQQQAAAAAASSVDEPGSPQTPKSPGKGRKVGAAGALDGSSKGMIDTNPPRGAAPRA